MKPLHTWAAIALVSTLAVSRPAVAGGDHDHDHGSAPPAAAGQALPRFAAESELFELVGVLKGKQLTLYLDRAADNSPVAQAQIELEIAGRKYQAVKQGDDTFEVVLPDAPPPGVLPVTATVSAGSDVDLLAAELDIHEVAPAEGPALAHAHGVPTYAAWATGGVALLGVLLLAGRRLRAARQARLGGAA
jgi:hypothetical protein